MIEEVRNLLANYRCRRIEPAGLMTAAVLVPLYPKDGQWHIVLTKRTDRVEHHKGQVSFPGGAVDATDGDLRFTALRESHEEIGLLPDDVEIVGQLDDIVTISNFCVTPFVGIVTRSPYAFTPHHEEVAALLEVPIPHLLDPANIRWEERSFNGRPVLLPNYLFGEHVIFGATARILSQFLELVAPLAQRVGWRP